MTPNKTTNNGNNQHLTKLEKMSVKLTNWVGTPQSIIAHSIFFVASLSLAFLGVDLDKILLVLTTVVSLEAIYLSLFIQMTVNRNTESLEDVEEDIEELQENVEEISEDIDDIQEEDKRDDAQDQQTKITLKNIEDDLDKLLADITNLKKNLSNTSNNKKFLNG